MRATLLAMIAAVGLVGCVGGISTEGGDPLNSPDGDGNDNGDNPAGADLSAAKTLFDSNVYPVINAKCTGGACHSETATGATLTRFVATDKAKGWQTATNYTALIGTYAPTTAPILTKIGNGGIHNNVSYSATEIANITGWLNKELELREGQPASSTTPPPGQETLAAATERVLSEFAGCMTKTDFDSANMAQSWGNMNAENNEQCKDCHVTGGFGMVASDISQQMWDVFANKKNYFLQFLTVDLTQGAAMAKVVVNTVSFKGVSAGLDPHREHPRFNAANNQGMTALTQFYTLTEAHKTGGTCATPRPLM